jgi:NAD(P)-dependent dehydrogenase (short-subunit alcohol dehydrogenase family)
MANSTTRVGIVTGAARGIGHAIARSLLASGWHLAVIDLPGSGVTRTFANERQSVIPLNGDVSIEGTAERAVAAVIERFGRIDGIVSNAGITRNKPLSELTLADWRAVIDVNLTATYLFARAAERPLRAAKGAILTIASTRAFMSEPNTEAYSASKGGLVALTHALAISLAPDVRVNCVSPGWIMTSDYAELRPKDHAQHPVGRVGAPDDIAQITGFLLDGERSGFITGANFIVDGGMTRKMMYMD